MVFTSIKKFTKLQLFLHSKKLQRKKIVNHAQRYGVNLNLDNPQSINDKMAWLELYEPNRRLKALCSDKIRLHDYCKKVLGEDICVPLLKVYNSPNDIRMDELPDRFVLKCNHGWNNNIVVTDKHSFDLHNAKIRLQEWLAKPFGFQTAEFHYIPIKRRCYAEMYIENRGKKRPVDYKISCFNGMPKILQIMNNRDETGYYINYYDMDFKLLDISPIGKEANNPDAHDTKPIHFEQMINYAKQLSKGFKYVRVDFYETPERLYLGELTFTPTAFTCRYTKPQTEYTIGNMLDL